MDGLGKVRLVTRWFVIDGDRVADLFDQAAMADIVEDYVGAQQAVDYERETLARALQATGAVVMMSAADGIVGRSSHPIDWPSIIRPSRISWSVGVGCTFRAAHCALSIAKSTGRGRVVWLDTDPLS